MTTEQTVTIPLSGGGSTHGVLHVHERFRENPEAPAVAIAHGASNDMHHPLIVGVARWLADDGGLVLRFNFPYSDRGAKRPDGQKTLERCWLSVLDSLGQEHGIGPDRIAAAGKSLGGRVAAQMAARDELPAHGLIFFGFPLHPPGRKEKHRSETIAAIRKPLLFFAGTRDPFCDLDLLRQALDQVQEAHLLHVIDGGDHSFSLPKSADRTGDDVAVEVARLTARWLSDMY